ncbi:class I SAM-dependent methyltransferase [Chamaesiphon sp.]|uniref:class I SAM-dependent methyltransferase n=1 Tax=Chamaesiphon sp. TaxID=2814140 RepID=UPI003593251A
MQSDEILNWYQTFTPSQEQRKSWYGSVAQTYDRVRPKYPPEFLDRAIEVTKIPATGKILEVGCGPGTATVGLAQMGLSIVALEPSLETYNVACQNLAAYPNVEIINTNFEECEPEARTFDAVVAATSWHWIAPEYKYIKAASLLKDGGSLILWNTAMQPPVHIFDDLTEIFDRYIPTLAKYKDPETQLSEMRIFAKAAIDSGLFSELQEESRSNQVNYSIDDYLQLLTTYSPAIALSPECRHELLAQLRDILAQTCGDRVPLAYLSAFHVASKISMEIP